MRDEISEPASWRANSRTRAGKVSRSQRKDQGQHSQALPADVVDAAFAEESVAFPAVSGSRRTHHSHRQDTGPSDSQQAELLRSLHDQLALLAAANQTAE